MSFVLLKATIKSNRTLWGIITGILVFYFSTVLTIFDPKSADALDSMLKMIPQGMLRAFGMGNMLGTDLTSFLADYMYGFLIFLFPLIYVIIMNLRLIAKQVDTGSMGYLLSTPNSRVRIANTQAFFSVASISLMFFVVTGATILFSRFIHPGHLHVGKFMILNLYALAMYVSISGIVFFFSCVCQEAKHSASLGAGVPIGFFVLKMLGSVSFDHSWIGKLSLYALFDPARALSADSSVLLPSLIFLALGGLLYGFAIFIFHRKDLHL